jgi:hypothetical protein
MTPFTDRLSGFLISGAFGFTGGYALAAMFL